jgi:RNA-directed DNA polymerase
MDRLGLALNEAKTSVRNARQERFDFLGYAFGPHHFPRNGRWYLGASPSKKSVQRIKDKVGEILVPGNHAPWSEVCDQLNGLLRGWRSYFDYGSHQRAFEAVDHHVVRSVRRFLVRRHKVPTRGTRRFTYTAVYGVLGVFQLNLRRHDATPCA